MSQPIPLNYAAAPPRWKKRVWLIVLIIGAACTGFSGLRWGPGAWWQCRLLYWQRQCMNFSPRADVVVYEEEPTAAAHLLTLQGYWPYLIDRREHSSVPSNPVQAAAFSFNGWTPFQSMLMPRPAMPIFNRKNPVGANLFLHGRISPAGHHRLVCVNYFPESDTFCQAFVAGYNYESQAITPATWTSAPISNARGYAFDVLSGWPRKPPLVRVYAGQIDGADSAHFTIRYQMWGQEDVLDGRLMDDDSITLTPRNPPKPPRE
jgi:hypothetical protein